MFNCVRQDVPRNFPKTQYVWSLVSFLAGVIAKLHAGLKARKEISRGVITKNSLIALAYIYVALDIFLLEFSPRLLLTAVDNYCELVFRVLSISFSLPLLVKLAYYENGALPPLEQLPSFARGNHDRFSENFAPWPGRAGHRILVSFFVSLFHIVH